MPSDPKYAQVGDSVTPLQKWNEHERFRKLAATVKIDAIRRGQSQTGYLFTVMDKDGKAIELDAGWFVEFQGFHR